MFYGMFNTQYNNSFQLHTRQPTQGDPIRTSAAGEEKSSKCRASLPYKQRAFIIYDNDVTLKNLLKRF